jgi:hypothetical protein
MRSFVACVLATLLAVTTPVGTGHGMHQDDLLHPIFPHLHLVNGHVVVDDDGGESATASVGAARVQEPSRPPAGPALGSGTGADGAGLGTATSPTVPQFALLPLLTQVGRLDMSRVAPPSDFLKLPEDPPPQPSA